MSTDARSTVTMNLHAAGRAGLEATLDDLLATVELTEATALARRGRYTEADAALVTARGTPAGLDLRARMAAQQGRLDDAAELWREAATRLDDPVAFAGELDALDRLRTRRRARLLPVGAAAVVAGALAVGGVAAGRWSAGVEDDLARLREDVLGAVDRQEAGAREADEALAAQLAEMEARLAASGGAPAAGSPEAGSPEAGSPETPEGRATPVPGPAAIDALEARLGALPGVEVERDGDSLRVRFPEPVFSEGTSLTPEGTASLASVGAAILPDASHHLVVVTGHTDGLPMRPGGRFATNGELAIARAQMGVVQLAAAGVPVTGVSVNVVPAPPPFGDDPAVAPRNRTVSLVVLPRA